MCIDIYDDGNLHRVCSLLAESERWKHSATEKDSRNLCNRVTHSKTKGRTLSKWGNANQLTYDAARKPNEQCFFEHRNAALFNSLREGINFSRNPCLGFKWASFVWDLSFLCRWVTSTLYKNRHKHAYFVQL